MRALIVATVIAGALFVTFHARADSCQTRCYWLGNTQICDTYCY